MVNRHDLIMGFKRLGLKQGDNIFVTSSLSRFGYVEGGAEAVIEALWLCVGANATIVMPSFNFSIFDKHPIVLDLKKTPSEMGAISEAFRKHSKRTSNLFHPLSYSGSLGKEIASCDMVNTWGEKSPYALMAKKNFKMVLLGTDFYHCPIFHYCEQRHNVPYREPIEYDGYVKDRWIIRNVKCKRLRRKYGDCDHNKLYKPYNPTETMIGTALCRSFNIGEMVEFCDNLLKADPNALLAKGSLLSPMPTMATPDMLILIEDLYKEPRFLVSDGFDRSLEYIKKFVPLRTHKWKSGERAWNWTIPLKEPEKVLGELKAGEYTVKGFSKETIILPIHLDHIYMANDNLSGVAVAIELIDRLTRTSDLKYNYKFLFVPETIGTIAYLSKFGREYKYGIVFDSVGAGEELKMVEPKTQSPLIDYITLPNCGFFSTEHLSRGNDERVLESVGIPSVMFFRKFKEYHTLVDTPDIIEHEKLKEALDEIYGFIMRIERDFTPTPTYWGVPHLSTYGLWDDDLNIERIWHCLHYKWSVGYIAHRLNLAFDYVYDFVMKLKSRGLVK